jgi:2-phosphosulfolactate phosphatase
VIIEITDFVAGARAARGITVIIDVFRAFSVAAYAFARGAEAIVPLASIEDARKLKQDHPDWLLIGERHGRPLAGFDCGNSPTELAGFEVSGRTLIQTTHSGTQGVVNAPHASEVLTGALVNAGAIARYIRSRHASCVTLVRMGHEAHARCEEDDLCAELIASRLRGVAPHVSGVRAQLRQAPSARRFFDPASDWSPETDFDACTVVDAFDFVVRLEHGSPYPRLRRHDLSS